MLLTYYVEEFIAIGNYLKKTGAQVHKNMLLVDRKSLYVLLNKNAYVTADQKLAAWCDLRWIDAEEGRSTIRVYDSSGRRVRRIAINLQVLDALQIKNLKYYVNEFMAIGSYLQKSGAQEYNHMLLINPKILEVLLNKNAYETAEHKLVMWRDLRWIDTEEGRSTIRIYDDYGRRIRKIAISKSVYETVKILSK